MKTVDQAFEELMRRLKLQPAETEAAERGRDEVLRKLGDFRTKYGGQQTNGG